MVEEELDPRNWIAGAGYSHASELKLVESVLFMIL